MATNLAFSGTGDQRAGINPGLVADYKEAHKEMLAAIAAMDVLACGPPPSQLRLSHTRLRITRASSESRSAFFKIIRILSLRPSATVANAVETLEKAHRDLREAARRHMSTWTHQEAQKDWDGYCQSSAEVRRLWRDIIAKERQLLYPLL